MRIGYFVYVLLFATIVFYARVQLKDFMHRHPAISSTQVLEEFKALARWNMRGALVVIGMFVLSLLWMTGVVVNDGAEGALVMCAANVAMYFASRNLKQVEDACRSMDCAPELAAEYRRVCITWTDRALPDF